jgi:DNA-binding NarL/FixJ family response regulator
MEPRIIIVDDHPLFRAGLKTMLEQQRFQVIAEAADGRQAAKLTAKLKPHAVITDISMPDRNGIELIRQMHRDFSAVKVVVVSMHDEMRLIMESFAAGASAYVLKDSAFEELCTAVRAVLGGRKYVSPAFADAVIERAVEHQLSRSRCEIAGISSREREVLQLVAEGRSTKEIAAALYISVKTVETHRAQLMNRLDLPNIAQLTKFAIREGITSVQQDG